MLESIKNSGNLMVATNAMGLGIDIPDIRLVIHVGSPVSMLDYVQESGRARRDGKDSVALLLHLPQVSIDTDMKHFITGVNCRRCTIDSFMDGANYRSKCSKSEVWCHYQWSRMYQDKVPQELCPI
jgi:superfamily II DNA/RNA helicase